MFSNFILLLTSVAASTPYCYVLSTIVLQASNTSPTVTVPVLSSASASIVFASASANYGYCLYTATAGTPCTAYQATATLVRPAACAEVTPSLNQVCTATTPSSQTLSTASIMTGSSASVPQSSTSTQLTMSNSAARLRLPLIGWIILLVQTTNAYITTIGSLVYSCSQASTSLTRTTSTSITIPVTSATTGHHGTGDACESDLDCGQRLGFCRNSICALGECLISSDCGGRYRCVSHRCSL